MTEIQDNKDLDHFMPAPSEKRIDDKAAVLESEVQSLKAGFGRERYIHIFISTIMFTFLVGALLESSGLTFTLVVSAVIFLLGLGKYYDFPWIVYPLEKWHGMLFECCHRRLMKGPLKTEEEQEF